MRRLSAKQQALVTHARATLGKPFLYGAAVSHNPQNFDCSSLVQYLYHHIGVALPRSALLQAAHGNSVTLSQLQVGDLLFFHGSVGHYNKQFPEGIGHVALYLGNGQVIHATGKRGRVVLSPIQLLFFRDRLIVIKRIFEPAAHTQKSSSEPQHRWIRWAYRALSCPELWRQRTTL